MSYIENLFDLKGKVAVVIGGTGELCSHMAFGLASAGVEVVLAGRSEEKATAALAKIEAAGGKGYFVQTELSDKGSLEALLATTLEKSGKVDILINGAGINSAQPFLDIPLEEFHKIMDINLGATFQACQIFGKYFIDRGQPASIINLGSISGLNPLSRVFVYSASKAAVHNISKNLAREWAEKEIRVNTLVPGFFPAEQNKKVLTPERVEDIMRHTPANRFGKPDELIGAVLLLSSHGAGSFITGTETVVDGGYDSMTI
ncbi:SDR family oxidoreductase [Persicirhabdus sediminis]|uniref:SDR family oxidoreductase n=1 Tax=Persicirhabdus sediminis TaxID=454144 RepID=A0A8J7SIG0_9BACT|nr:SDR family NAD(P)-dependent oxidoreductase [Persicirhabdus sediminis]MBK1790574.1 SDR family oxidoreductase [Persicirhabdus sediminis]